VIFPSNGPLRALKSPGLKNELPLANTVPVIKKNVKIVATIAGKVKHPRRLALLIILLFCTPQPIVHIKKLRFTKLLCVPIKILASELM
jgi:hypothetical protein